MPRNKNAYDYTGFKNDYIEVVGRAPDRYMGPKRYVRLYWTLKCLRCGNLFEARTAKVITMTSCGCKMGNQFKSKHRLYNHSLYYTYKCMKGRCHNPKADNYNNYGAKGISVCEEWLAPVTGIQSFVKWAEENGWSEESGLQLDREDNNGNYCPENCRWVPPKINARNRSTNYLVDLNGEQVPFVAAFEFYKDITKVGRYGAYQRIKRGWKTEDAFLIPPRCKPN